MNDLLRQLPGGGPADRTAASGASEPLVPSRDVLRLKGVVIARSGASVELEVRGARQIATARQQLPDTVAAGAKVVLELPAAEEDTTRPGRLTHAGGARLRAPIELALRPRPPLPGVIPPTTLEDAPPLRVTVRPVGSGQPALPARLTVASPPAAPLAPPASSARAGAPAPSPAPAPPQAPAPEVAAPRAAPAGPVPAPPAGLSAPAPAPARPQTPARPLAPAIPEPTSPVPPRPAGGSSPSPAQPAPDPGAPGAGSRVRPDAGRGGAPIRPAAPVLTGGGGPVLEAEVVSADGTNRLLLRAGAMLLEVQEPLHLPPGARVRLVLSGDPDAEERLEAGPAGRSGSAPRGAPGVRHEPPRLAPDQRLAGQLLELTRQLVQDPPGRGEGAPPARALPGVQDQAVPARDPAGGTFRMLELTFGQAAERVPLRLLVKDDPPDDGRPRPDSRRSRPRRAILELNLDTLGPCQLDLLCQDRRIDLQLRSRVELPAALCSRIHELFAAARDLGGLEGELSFAPGALLAIGPSEAPARSLSA